MIQSTLPPLVLCILDGWGHRQPAVDNAISSAHTPNWDRMLQKWPHTLLQASEEHVGLPKGQMGNSEVGHTNLGAGRVVLQNLPRINKAVADDSLKDTHILQQYCQRLQRTRGTSHLCGLLSPGGVHSHINHIIALAHIIAKENIPVIIHGFLDGRDTPPQSAEVFLNDLQTACAAFPQITIGTISGRYYAMDRDQRWDRVKQAYGAIVNAQGPRAPSPQAALHDNYQKQITDEFVIPTIIGDYQGIRDGDGLLMANFRADRARQILAALCDPEFTRSERSKTINFAARVGMVEYSMALNRFLSPLFPPINLFNTLGEIIAQQGLNQLRIAETEKYAHVTFFFNGGREEPFVGEDRLLIPSPQVATYDLQPAMSAHRLTSQLIEAMQQKDYALIVVNYANTDMVGHTGDQQATQQAVETVDQCLGQLEQAVLTKGGTLLITADHGNAEVMLNAKTGNPHTAHTCEPVPFVLVAEQYKNAKLHSGKLADVAATILKLMEIYQPKDMTGVSLLSSVANF